MAYKRADFKLDETNYIDKRIEEAAIDGVKWDKIVRSPTFETKIIKAVFTNQDVVVFPQDVRTPDNLSEVVKFLFGEGAVVTQDYVNNYNCIRITGASYVLDNVRTINAEWEYKEVKDVLSIRV